MWLNILKNFRIGKLTGEHSKALLRDAKMIIPAPGFSVFLNESLAPLNDQLKAVNLNCKIHVD